MLHVPDLLFVVLYDHKHMKSFASLSSISFLSLVLDYNTSNQCQHLRGCNADLVTIDLVSTHISSLGKRW